MCELKFKHEKKHSVTHKHVITKLDYDERVQGMTLRLETATSNGPVVIPYVIYEHRGPWWNDIGRGTPNSSITILCQSYKQNHLVAK
jgi:hypothetical protein